MSPPATGRQLPFRVRVIASWWCRRGWFSPPHDGCVIGDDRIYVFTPAVPVAGAILVHGELMDETDPAMYALCEATDEADRRGCHLAVGVIHAP